jgi:hypothetical protein
MAETLQIEVADDGTIAKVPEAVQKLIDKAYGKARAEATDAATKANKDEIDRLKKAGELSATDREKLRTLEGEHSKAQEELARAKNDHAEADRIRNERHQKELTERDGKLTTAAAEIEKRTELYRKAVLKDVLIAAAKEGARNESLPELEVLLGGRIGLDESLQPFVRDEKDPGKPLLDKDQKPVTIEGFVKQYLADHPHHKTPVSGRGGGARGGRTGQGGEGATGEKAEALAELERTPSVRALAGVLRHAGKSA